MPDRIIKVLIKDKELGFISHIFYRRDNNTAIEKLA